MMSALIFFFENNSSQESQCIRNSLVTDSRSTSERKKKVKKFNCKKGAREKSRGENLCHALAHRQQKVGMKDCGNSRNFHGKIISGNKEVGSMLPSIEC